MTSHLIIPVLTVQNLSKDNKWPSPLAPTLHAQAQKNGWELIKTSESPASLEHIGDDQSLDKMAQIRVALLATHPKAEHQADPLEIMAAKSAAMIMLAEEPHSYSKMMELAAQYLSQTDAEIYFATEFFDKDNKLCHNAIVTANEAMQLLEQMNASTPNDHPISMTITSRVPSSEACGLTLEQRGLPDPNQ